MSPSVYLRTVQALVLALLAGAAIRSAALPADKPDTWVEVRTPHFIVTSNDGEKTARRIADQFEQIRSLYANSFQKTVRVDPSIPIVIFAVKNEKALSQLLPEYWAQKGHSHPAGLFVPGAEKNYIALRTDVETEFPYQAIYHEYVHLIVSLNFQHIPVWLNEGYAEFFGNTSLTGTGGKVGEPNSWDLELLNQTKLLPLDVLFKVDEHSPYYNEANKVNIFYAESWALVHYLQLDPEMRKRQPLKQYIPLIESGVDPLDAAKRAFGDLAQLQKQLEAYVKRTSYFAFVVPLQSNPDSKDYAVRDVAPAEADARLGDFDLYRGQLDGARPKLEESIRLDANLPSAQESTGYLLFRQQKRDEADKYFARAIELDSKSALAHYYHAMLLMSQGASSEDMAEAQAALEKSVALNPEFAPAWSNLGILYLRNRETLDKALQTSLHAVDLKPGDARFQYNIAVVLARLARFDEARKIAQRLQTAGDPAIASSSAQLLAQLDQAQRYASAPPRQEDSPALQTTPVIKLRIESSADEPASTSATKADETEVASTPPANSSPHMYSMVGTISEPSCKDAPQLLLTLKAATIVMHLHAADLAHVPITSAGSASSAKAASCTGLGGRSARISYLLSSGNSWDGEIQAIELRNAP